MCRATLPDVYPVSTIYYSSGIFATRQKEGDMDCCDLNDGGTYNGNTGEAAFSTITKRVITPGASRTPRILEPGERRRYAVRGTVQRTARRAWGRCRRDAQ